MNGQVFIERPLGTVVSAGNVFNCTDCATRTSTAGPYYIQSGAQYYHRFTTAIDVPYGNIWLSWPSWCAPSGNRLGCTFTHTIPIINF